MVSPIMSRFRGRMRDLAVATTVLLLLAGAGFSHWGGLAETIALADATGLAGCSIEDYGPAQGIYPRELAAERVRAAIVPIGTLM